MIFNKRKLFNVTSKVAPISANIAIQSVNQPGMTKSNSTNLIAKEKVMFCLMIAKALNDEQVRSKESFIKRNIALIISLGFILVAVISQISLGEDHLLTKALYILAIIIGGFDLFKEGFSDLIKLDFSMESLMTIAIIGAAFIGEWAEGSIVVIIIMALLIVVVPPLFFGGDWNKWLYQGLSILVVGCPCSLVISTPVSIVSAIGNAAKNGVLVKGGVYLEEIGHLRAIAFDKTGTLTKGKPVVTDFIATSSETDINYLSIISSLESLSQHPLASAILNEADKTNVDYKSIQIEDFQSITGKGLTGIHQNIRYYIGSPKLFSASVIEETAVKVQYRQFQEQGKTAMYFGTDEQILGVIAVADEVRDSSAAVISELHKLSIEHTIMLTGDNTKTAESIGKQLGVTEIKGDLMPQEKLDSIKALRTTYNKVAMVGDGINDAPALAASTVGIAMGGAGTDTALETADVALMGDDLQKLPFIVRLSRQTLKVIKQNITFSLCIKLLALLLVIPGWLTLWIAIVADMGATLLVTLNGLRLMKVK